jgi:hypothetical protein
MAPKAVKAMTAMVAIAVAMAPKALAMKTTKAMERFAEILAPKTMKAMKASKREWSRIETFLVEAAVRALHVAMCS